MKSTENPLNARYGDDGKVWHLAAHVALGAAMWAVLYSTVRGMIAAVKDY